MKTYNTYLPIFNGFYESIFSPDGESSEMEYIDEEREKIGLKPLESFDEVDWDYKEYNLRVSKKCVEVIDEAIGDIIEGLSFTFEGLVSPEYYNYSTDSINVEVKVEDMDNILQYLIFNDETFAKYIKERYTSYDGFHSFMSNDSNVWIEEIQRGEDLGHKLGSVMDFILTNEGYDTWDLHDGLDGENYITAKNYDELTTKN